MSAHEKHERSVRKLAEKVKGIRVAMLTTMSEDGVPRSRPMGAQDMDAEGRLWFFTSADSDKAREIAKSPCVCVSYAHMGSSRYVSVSGKATVVDDREKAKELWSPLLGAWFPQGTSDPNLRLVRVDVERAEYWDAPAGKVVMLAGFIKEKLGGKPPSASKVGEHDKIGL